MDILLRFIASVAVMCGFALTVCTGLRAAMYADTPENRVTLFEFFSAIRAACVHAVNPAKTWPSRTIMSVLFTIPLLTSLSAAGLFLSHLKWFFSGFWMVQDHIYYFLLTHAVTVICHNGVHLIVIFSKDVLMCFGDENLEKLIKKSTKKLGHTDERTP